MTTQETEEQKAKEFFRQLKQGDERSTPGFDRVLGTDVLSNERKAGRWLSLRVVMSPIALMLVLLAGGWFLFGRQEQTLYPPPLPEAANLPGKLPDHCCESLIASKGNKPPKALRHTRSAPPMQISALISQWRSPTEFLLKTPDERWLKEVPRLGVPRIEIKPLEFEQKNEMEEL